MRNGPVFARIGMISRICLIRRIRRITESKMRRREAMVLFWGGLLCLPAALAPAAPLSLPPDPAPPNGTSTIQGPNKDGHPEFYGTVEVQNGLSLKLNHSPTSGKVPAIGDFSAIKCAQVHIPIGAR